MKTINMKNEIIASLTHDQRLIDIIYDYSSSISFELRPVFGMVTSIRRGTGMMIAKRDNDMLFTEHTVNTS